MANWQRNFTDINQVNGGQEFSINDYPTTDGFNVPINNTQYLHDNSVGTWQQTFDDNKKAQAKANLGIINPNFNGYYGSIPDRPVNLSDLNDDANHRLVTDSDIANWNDNALYEIHLEIIKTQYEKELHLLFNLTSKNNISSMTFNQLLQFLVANFKYGADGYVLIDGQENPIKYFIPLEDSDEEYLDRLEIHYTKLNVLKTVMLPIVIRGASGESTFQTQIVYDSSLSSETMNIMDATIYVNSRRIR